jgi:uridine kinase
MDERADRERTAADVSAAIKEKMADTLKIAVGMVRERIMLRGSPLLVAIDGGTGAGKSTLALLLAAKVDGVIVQGDDFYQTGIDWSKKSAAEKASLCIDWKRARKEALEPLLAGKTASWHPFNFATGVGLADYQVTRKSAPVIIIDGIYSANPELKDILGLTILINTPQGERVARHNLRERHIDLHWHSVWNEAEIYYLTKVRPPSAFDLVLSA